MHYGGNRSLSLSLNNESGFIFLRAVHLFECLRMNRFSLSTLNCDSMLCVTFSSTGLWHIDSGNFAFVNRFLSLFYVCLCQLDSVSRSYNTSANITIVIGNARSTWRVIAWKTISVWTGQKNKYVFIQSHLSINMMCF